MGFPERPDLIPVLLLILLVLTRGIAIGVYTLSQSIVV